MSITTEILRIKGGKSDIKSLVQKKNIEIPESVKIDRYAEYLGQNWPKATIGVTYDGTKVRGKTEKSENLCSEVKKGGIGSQNSVETTTRARLDFYGSPYLKIKAGETYSVGCFEDNNNWDGIYYRFTDANKNIISSGNVTATGSLTTFRSVTAPQGAEYFYCHFYKGSGYTELPNEPMVIESTVIPTEYKESFLGLRYAYYKGIKLGSCDYVDLSSNKLHIGGKETDLGEMTYVTVFGSNQIKLYQTPILSDMKTTSSAATVISNLFCGKYETVSGNAQFSGNAGDKCVAAWSTQQRFAFRDDFLPDAISFKNGNVGTKIYYELATPIEIDLS